MTRTTATTAMPTATNPCAGPSIVGGAGFLRVPQDLNRYSLDTGPRNAEGDLAANIPPARHKSNRARLAAGPVSLAR